MALDNAASVPAVTTAQPSSKNAATAEASASQRTAGAGEETSGSTRFNSLEDLKEKAPQVYNAMMLGIAQNICKDMQEAQQRLKTMMRESRRDT